MRNHFGTLTALFIFLAACAPAQASLTASPAPTEQIKNSATPTPSAALSVALDKESCLAEGGDIEQHALASEFLAKELAFRVYTPPCYAEHAPERYPVLYLIHGQTYNDDQWERLGAGEETDQLIASGMRSPFIIVMPADASHYTQPATNGFDEALVNELIPWVDETYRTLADREHRAVGGLSRGASWALHLALTHPELFGAVGGHSPPVFQEDASRVRGWLDEIPSELMPRVWLDIGDRDQRAILDSATWLESLLDERDLPHEWYLFSGDHSEEYWSGHVELYLRWYSAKW